jgi:(1->4)-alpha-D-glucan 1-alpha-D-glucosylmutase
MPDAALLTATYRLQLHAGFPLASAREIVPYLAELGISHAYTSPVLAARAGSQHGYDSIDPTRLNPELGPDDALRRFVDALREERMGWLLDIVPNHMAASLENPFWADVLRLGTRSPYARWFDIVWDAPEQWLRGRVMLPLLGDELDAVLARDEIRVAFEDGRFAVRYYEHALPVDPATVWRVFDAAHGLEDGPVANAVRRLVDASRHYARRNAADGSAAGDDDSAHGAGVERAIEELARLGRDAGHGADIASTLHEFSSGEAGRGRLRALLDAQPYALSFWRRAARNINYRRFFEINDLVSLRQEDPDVFGATHARILDWISSGWLDGVRVDHVDGLFDPAEYLYRLRRALDARRPGGAAPAPIYVEKILEHDEQLRSGWPVAGTTGYEALNDIESVLIDPEGATALERTYRDLLGLGERAPGFSEVARRAKQYVLRHSFDSDVRRVARLVAPVLRRRDREARTSRRMLREMIAQLAAALPVYRTYLTGGDVAPEDRALIERAEAIARAGGAREAALLARITDVLLREDATDAGDTTGLRRRAIARFQQTTSPAMAKGIEDTALYMYAPLASLNEVGGTPDRDLTHAVERLHRVSAERRARWPRALVCTFTHDTKRSADVRARLDVLSEIPDRWADAVRGWRPLLRGARRKVRGRYEPDANTEYLLFQALLGTWPEVVPDDPHGIPDAPAREELRERIEEYILKAAREAKMRTSWIEPNEPFEEALRGYVRALLAEPGPFLASMASLARDVVRPGFWNALSRIVMHMASPGVPDLYQGGELWSFALVDPDNRRPVDYTRRRETLAELRRRFDGADADGRLAVARELLESPEDGRIKMHVTRQLLRTRCDDPELFLEGSYAALDAGGTAARHVIAFARSHAGRTAIAVAPRLARTLAGGVAPPIGDLWADTRVFLPEPLFEVNRWTCVVTGNSVDVPRGAAATGLPVADLLRHLPVALLVRADR